MSEAATDPTSERAAELLRAVLRAMRPASPRDWTALDLTMAQTKALFVLHHEGPTKVRDLAAALGISAPSMTGTLDRLVQRGLVERLEDRADRRLVIIALGPAGQALVEQLQQVRRARIMAAMAQLDPAARSRLAESLAALLAAFQATSEPEAQPVVLAAASPALEADR